MKNRQYSILTIAALLLLIGAPKTSYGATAAKPATVPTSSTVSALTADETVTAAIPDSLRTRKEHATDDLQATADKLNAIAQKISTTIVHLSGSAVATDASQSALLKAETNILSSTVALSTLSKTLVLGESIPRGYTGIILDESMVKKNVGDIQDSLLLARQGLIDSLTALKSSLISHQ